MAQISNKSRDVFRDACGILEFTDAELKEIDKLAADLKRILNVAKKRNEETAR